MVFAITTSEMVQWYCSSTPKPSLGRGQIEYHIFDFKISIVERTRVFWNYGEEEIGF